jgi:hypothetical protein
MANDPNPRPLNPPWPANASDGSGDERGWSARAPTEIPPKGWRDVILRVFHGISEDRITTISGGVTFFVLLAVFLGLAGLISLYGLVADSGTISQHLRSLGGILPEGGIRILQDEIKQLASQPPQKLGFATVSSLAISLFGREWWHKGDVRGPKCGARGKRKTRFLQAERSFTRIGSGCTRLCNSVPVDNHGGSETPFFRWSAGHRRSREFRPLAASSCRGLLHDRGHLLFQPEPRTAAMALDLAGKHLCCCYLDRGIVVGIFFSYPPTKTRSNTRRCR